MGKTTVNQLLWKLKSGARPNRFRVVINLPQFITNKARSNFIDNAMLDGGDFIKGITKNIPGVNGKIDKALHPFDKGGISSSAELNQIDLICKSASFPEMTLNTIDVWSRGNKFTVRDTVEFNNKWDVTFYNMETHNYKELFEQWIYQVNKFDSSDGIYTEAEIAEYMGNARVFQLNGPTDITASYEMSYLFPTNISSIPLNTETTNQISDFTVTFAFSKWKRI